MSRKVLPVLSILAGLFSPALLAGTVTIFVDGMDFRQSTWGNTRVVGVFVLPAGPSPDRAVSYLQGSPLGHALNTRVLGSQLAINWNGDLSDTVNLRKAVAELQLQILNASRRGDHVNLVAHSMGTVIGYQALKNLSERTTASTSVYQGIDHFVTLASPLGSEADLRVIRALTVARSLQNGRVLDVPDSATAILSPAVLRIRGQWTNAFAVGDEIGAGFISAPGVVNISIAARVGTLAHSTPYQHAPTIGSIVSLLGASAGPASETGGIARDLGSAESTSTPQGLQVAGASGSFPGSTLQRPDSTAVQNLVAAQPRYRVLASAAGQTGMDALTVSIPNGEHIGMPVTMKIVPFTEEFTVKSGADFGGMLQQAAPPESGRFVWINNNEVITSAGPSVDTTAEAGLYRVEVRLASSGHSANSTPVSDIGAMPLIATMVLAVNADDKWACLGRLGKGCRDSRLGSIATAPSQVRFGCEADGQGVCVESQMSIGAIKHDRCCQDYPDGQMCGGSLQIEPEHCGPEWSQAVDDRVLPDTPTVRRMFPGMWRYPATSTDGPSAGSDQWWRGLAPVGAVIGSVRSDAEAACEAATYCASGTFRKAAQLSIKAGLAPLGTFSEPPPTEIVYVCGSPANAAAGSAPVIGSSSTVGSCEASAAVQSPKPSNGGFPASTSAPAAISTSMPSAASAARELLATLGSLQGTERYAAFAEAFSAGRIPAPVAIVDAIAIGRGMGDSLFAYVRLIAPRMGGALTAPQFDGLAGEARGFERLKILAAIDDRPGIVGDLSAADLNLIISGMSNYRAAVITAMARRLRANLGPRDVIEILGDSSSLMKLPALDELKRAGRIRAPLSEPEIAAIAVSFGLLEGQARQILLTH